MNSQAYQCVQGSHLLPKAKFLAGENSKFQQENALVDASNNTKHLFLVNNVEILKGPAVSRSQPNKNLWYDLAIRVYGNKRHFMSSADLKSTIKNEWYKTEQEHCQELISSMKTKIFQIIQRNGPYTSF